jgi:hypothetical protein
LAGYQFEQIFPGCRIIDIHEFLAEKGVKLSGVTGVKYMYHDPCHSPMKLQDPLRTVNELIQLEDGKAIQKNGGLFTQCTNTPLGSGWCKKCAKDVEKNGTPSNGDVEARLAADVMAYKVGKTEVKPYIEYMMKNGITPEQVEEAAAEYGLTVDPRQYEKKKRGRKNTTPRTMAPAAIAEPEAEEPEAEEPEAEEPEEEEEGEELKEELVETVTTVDLGALHKDRLARAAKAAKEAAEEKEMVVDDKQLTILEINGMKKEEVHAACARYGISIDGKNILDLKKALKATVK